jgi:hypothetical protein
LIVSIDSSWLDGIFGGHRGKHRAKYTAIVG